MKDEEVMQLDFSNWPLPDAFSLELGRVSACWGSLEATLVATLSRLSGFSEPLDPRGFILVAHASFPQRLHIFETLCEQSVLSGNERAKNYATVTSALKSAQTARNNFAHHWMSVSPESGDVEMMIGSARGKLKASVEPVTLANIRRAIVAIHTAEITLREFATGTAEKAKWER